MATSVLGAANKRVALIEDDEDIRAALTAILADEGYSVDAYNNGLDALRALQAGPRPDVIVLDLRLPGLDGWQFRLAQKAERTLSDVPLVAMSADGSPKARAIDAECFLAKPLDAQLFIDSIRRVLEEAADAQKRARSLALARMASVGMLAAGMAHEVNNPLAYVTANLRLIAEQLPVVLKEALAPLSGDDPSRAHFASGAREIRQMIAECLEGTERIRKVVHDVQMLSHLDDAPRVHVDPKVAIASAIDLAKDAVISRARFETRLDPIPLVRADETRLTHVFVHLIVNAVQSVKPDSEGVVTIVTSTNGNGDAEIAITDTGSGMTKDVRDRIFEPFFTTKGVGLGAGLGLAICHGIVTALGGEITIRSEVGVGSTFSVLLPGVRASSEMPESSVVRAAAPRRARILIVDDEPTIARVLGRVLSKAHDVILAGSGQEALDVLTADDAFDVILCDLLMPGIGGIDLYNTLSKRAPGLEKRLIFMTGGAFSPQAIEFVGRVPNTFLEKPLDNNALFGAIRARIEEADK